MPSPGQLIFSAVMIAMIAAVVALTGREVRRFGKAACSLSRRHRLLRMVAGILLLCLLGMVFFGGFAWMEPTASTIHSTLAYWTRCSVLGYIVIVLGFADLSLVMRLRRRERRARRQQRKPLPPVIPAEQLPVDD